MEGGFLFMYFIVRQVIWYTKLEWSLKQFVKSQLLEKQQQQQKNKTLVPKSKYLVLEVKKT